MRKKGRKTKSKEWYWTAVQIYLFFYGQSNDNISLDLFTSVYMLKWKDTTDDATVSGLKMSRYNYYPNFDNQFGYLFSSGLGVSHKHNEDFPLSECDDPANQQCISCRSIMTGIPFRKDQTKNKSDFVLPLGQNCFCDDTFKSNLI